MQQIQHIPGSAGAAQQEQPPAEEKQLPKTGMTTLVDIASIPIDDRIGALRTADREGLEPAFMPTLIDLATNPSLSEYQSLFNTSMRSTPSLFISHTGQGRIVAHIPTGVIVPETMEKIEHGEGDKRTINTNLLAKDVPRLFDLEGLMDDLGRVMVATYKHKDMDPGLYTFKIKDVLKSPIDYEPIFPFFGGAKNTIRYLKWITARHPNLAKRKLRLTDNCSSHHCISSPTLANYYHIALLIPEDDMEALFYLRKVVNVVNKNDSFLYVTKGAGYERKAQPTVEHVLRIAAEGFMGSKDRMVYMEKLKTEFGDRGIPPASVMEIIEYAQPHLSPTRKNGFGDRLYNMFMYSCPPD